MTKYRKPEPPLVRMYQGPDLEEQGTRRFPYFGAFICLICLFIVFNGFFQAFKDAPSSNDEMVTLRDGTICAVRNKREITCNEAANKADSEHFKTTNPAIKK